MPNQKTVVPYSGTPEQEAKLEMARRYFTHMGPSTIHDAMYYFHTTAAQVKEWLSKLPVSAVECAGKTYYYIDSGQTYDQEMPKCLFLAGFDQLLLAHERRKASFCTRSICERYSALRELLCLRC